MRNANVLISGAGIAGPLLGWWLRRYGFEPTIVERSPEARPGGQAVDIRGAARNVVEQMGLLPDIRAASVRERGIAFVDERGRIRATMAADAFGGEGIVAEIEILRGDLSTILVDATRPDIEYLFDDSITELVDADDGVRVTFGSGARRSFDLVIGADGVHSRVRRLTRGDESAFVRPLGGYTAYFTMAGPPPRGDWFLLYNAPGGRAAAIRPDREANTKAMLSFRSSQLDDQGDAAEQMRILEAVFAGVGWQVPQLLAAMRDARDFHFDTIAQVHMDRWTHKRTALVGDAGYAASHVSGLGTSLAIVGAYVLAGELANAGGDHTVAFPRYEAELRPYVTQCQDLPPGGIKGFLPGSPAAIWMRDQSTSLMTRWPFRLAMRGVFEKADSISLKDYTGSKERPLSPSSTGAK